jgi:hypothetical protein
MRDTMKRTLAVLASLALIPATAAAWTVKSPHPGTVTALTYYPSGGYHGAVDISSAKPCSYWGVETGVVGSISWNVTIRTTGEVCYGSGSGNQNEAKHTFGDGWSFRLWHFIKTAASNDKTCDRCQVGDEGGTGNATGPHTHLQRDKLGTLGTAWYDGWTVRGEFVDRTETIGDWGN